MISRSYTLPCGVKLKNRIIKSAMSENMAYTKFTPGKEFQNLYRTWSNGGAGVLISGNIMIDSSALGEPYNIVVAKNIDNFKELRLWAESVKKGGSEL